MGSHRGRKFLEDHVTIVEEFVQYCRGDFLEQQDQKMFGTVLDDQVKPKLKIPGSVNKLKSKTNKKQTTVFSQSDPSLDNKDTTTNNRIVSLKPDVSTFKVKEEDKISDSEGECEDSDIADTELNNESEELNMENTKPLNVVGGSVVPKGNIVVVNAVNLNKFREKSSRMNTISQSSVLGKDLNSLTAPKNKTSADQDASEVTKHHQITPDFFKCDQCEKKYRRNLDLIIHKRKHSGEAPFACQICSRAFRSRKYLRQHGIVHTSNKPYNCETCGALFARLSGLNRHKAQVHSDATPWMCDTCGRGFKDQSALHVHKLRHTGEKRHFCQWCGRGFLRLYDLKGHRRLHTGEKPFRCDTCGASYRHKTKLVAHQRTKHKF